MREEHQRGFTLSQLLVLLVLALVVAVLVTPMCSQRRRIITPRRQLSDLKTLGQLLAIYANEYQGVLFNPFETMNMETESWRANPNEPNADPIYAPADSFSYVAAGELHRWGSSPNDYRDFLVSPKDVHTRKRLKREWKQERLIPCSYWYSATMYYSPVRFADPDSGSTAKGARWGHVERHRLDEVRFPSQKVTFFQKQDFGGSEPCLFSHPEAAVPLVLADGSGTFSHNRKLITAIDEDPSLAPSGGNWADPNLADYGMDSKKEGLAEQQGLYPAFYQWTRDGIHGRDLL